MGIYIIVQGKGGVLLVFYDTEEEWQWWQCLKVNNDHKCGGLSWKRE